MADKTLQINLIAKDQISGTMKKIAVETNETASALSKAGEKGEAAFNKVDVSAKRAALSAHDLSVILTTVGGALAYSGTMAMQQERQMIALTRVFGDAGDEMIDFAQQLDDVTIFSDDDIRAGERFFATLKNNYDLSIDQIKELMTVTAELAAASGVSFEDASNRVTAAIRGEGEAAEWLGLTMNQQSIDRQNLTLTMTNQEAAQFRLKALYEQSAPYIGTNNDLMKTGIGTIAEWQDTVQDAAASVGGFLGPVASLSTGVGTLGIGLSGLTGTFTAFRALPGAVASGFTGKLIPALTTTTGLFGVMGVATAGLALGAYKLWDSYKEGQRVIDTLTASYKDMYAAQNEALLSGNIDVANHIASMNSQVQSVRLNAAEIYKEGIGRNSNIAIDQLGEFQKQYELTQEDADSLAASQQTLAAAFNDTRIDGDALFVAMDNLYWSFMRKDITADEYVQGLEYLSQHTADYAVATDSATEATERFSLAMVRANAINNIAGSIQEGLAVKHRYTAAAYLEQATWVQRLGFAYKQSTSLALEMAAADAKIDHRYSSDRWREQANAQWLLGDAVRESTSAQLDFVNTQQMLLHAVDLVVSGIDGATAAVKAYREEQDQITTDNLNALIDLVGYGDPLSRWNLAGNATDMSTFAMQTMHASDALNSVYRVAVGNTNALGQQSDAIQQWAKDLIGVQGEYSKLDDLVKAGRITGQSGVFTGDSEYAQAQRAYNDITRENAEIQEHILTIQAMQVPLIRDQMATYEDYLQEVADMPAKQQLVALGWMDATEAGRAMEFQTLAVAAATGQLGSSGEAVFTSMITGAAQADPVLKGLLEDMGLISVGADGTITVDFSSVEGAQSEIALLTESIDALIVTLGGVPPHVETEVSVVDNATSPLHSILDLIYSLPDHKVTTIQTVLETHYRTTGTSGVLPYATGGVIQSRAVGGVLAELAEVGPEVLHFAGGGTAFVGQRGIYSVQPGTYVSPSNAVSNTYGGITIDFSGAVFHNTSREEMNQWAGEDFLPAIRDELQRQRVGQGVF